MNSLCNNLSGKVAVVTGASRGLGLRAAMRLASEGAAVALLARNLHGLDQVKQQIEHAGGRAISVPGDLSQRGAVEQAALVIERDLGTPSILVNAAGVFGPLNLIKDGDADAWIETLMTNTVVPYLTCRAFERGMIELGWGRIVNVSSAAALHEPGPLNSAYGTSKAALNHFTRHLASELYGTGVTANVIHPGDVKTDMWADIKSASERLGPVADAYMQWANWVDATGGDDPEKAADLISELMSDKAADVNGRFVWITDGLQAPIASWDEPKAAPPWREDQRK